MSNYKSQFPRLRRALISLRETNEMTQLELYRRGWNKPDATEASFVARIEGAGSITLDTLEKYHQVFECGPTLVRLYFDEIAAFELGRIARIHGPRISFLGAFNYDLLVTRASLNALLDAVAAAVTGRFEPNTERVVSWERIKLLLDLVLTGDVRYAHHVGGSAYNVSRALNVLGDPTAFIGVVGDAREIPGLSLGDADPRMELYTSELSDPSGLRWAGREKPGIAVAVENEAADRGLEVWPGSNLHLADHLEHNRDKITSLIAETDILHLTSLAGSKCTTAVAQLLDHLETEEVHPLISVDPGFIWASQALRPSDTGETSPVTTILSHADIIMVNDNELAALTEPHVADGADTETRLTALHAHLPRKPQVVLLIKRGDRVLVRMDSETIEHRSETPVPNIEVVEDTGAGDFFAAGFLNHIDSRPLAQQNLDRAIQAGMAAASIKLRNTVDSALQQLGHRGVR